METSEGSNNSEIHKPITPLRAYCWGIGSSIFVGALVYVLLISKSVLKKYSSYLTPKYLIFASVCIILIFALLYWGIYYISKAKPTGNRFLSFWKGFYLALILGVPVIIIGIGFAADEVTTLLVVSVILIVIFVSISTFLFLFKDILLSKLLLPNVTRGLDDLFEPLEKALPPHKNGEERKEAIINLSKYILSWYSWSRIRIWVFRIGISLVATFSVLVGSALLFIQNTLIQKQNIAIRGQLSKTSEQLMEQTRSNLRSEISRHLLLMTKDRKQLWVAINYFKNIAPSNQNKKVSALLRKQIYDMFNKSSGALSCRFLELFFYLTDNQVPKITKSYKSDGIGFIDCHELQVVELQGLTLAGLQLKHFNFAKVQLNNADFEKTRISDSSFDRVNFENTSFVGAKIENTSFKDSNLQECIFNKVNFLDVSFRGANLLGAKFDEIPDFDRVDFTGSLIYSRACLQTTDCAKIPSTRAL